MSSCWKDFLPYKFIEVVERRSDVLQHSLHAACNERY